MGAEVKHGTGPVRESPEEGCLLLCVMGMMDNSLKAASCVYRGQGA